MTVPALPDPYCSTCRQPAVWRESWGVLHIRQDGSVIHSKEDRSGHEPDLADWSAEYDRIQTQRRKAMYEEGLNPLQQHGRP